jgi:CheY-like chemotaxis protein
VELRQDFLKGWPVLVVDDDLDHVGVVARILQYHGATIFIASNGYEALQILQRVHPRFILSDLEMPELDGWGLIRFLRQDPKRREIPVIAITGHNGRDERERVLQAGFYQYLLKPFTGVSFMRDLMTVLITIPELARDLVDEV